MNDGLYRFTINNQLMIRSTSQTRVPLILLLVLTIVALVFILGSLIYTFLVGMIGFSMEPSTVFLCNSYSTDKLQTMKPQVLEAVFICGLISAFLQVINLIYYVYLLVKNSRGEGQQEITSSNFVFLYISTSLSIVGLIPGTGYYTTFIIQQGINCTSNLQLNWIVLGVIFAISLLTLLICWIYLIILQKKLQKLEGSDYNTIDERRKEQMEKQPHCIAHFVQQLLMKQRIEAEAQRKEENLKQPLIIQVEQQDRLSIQSGEREKLKIVAYDQYRRKLEEDAKKQREREENRLRKLEKQEEERRNIEQEKIRRLTQKLQLKIKIKQLAISPNDQNFDEIFKDSQEEAQAEQKQQSIPIQSVLVQNKVEQQLSEQEYYQPNYIPKDQKDKIRYQLFQSDQARKIQKPKIRKHPQNLDGGRSKSQFNRLLKKNRRPVRNQEARKSRLSPSNSHFDMSDFTSQLSQKQSATFKKVDQKIPEIQVNEPIHQKSNVSSKPLSPKITIQDKLYLHKQRSKTPTRKKLFEQESNYLQSLDIGPILSTLVKGTIDSQRSSRIRQIKQGRSSGNRIKKSEKLIDFIRSKFV